MRLAKNKKESKMTLESTIRKMHVKEIDLDELIESLDEGGMKDKLLKTADLLQKLIKPGDPDRHDFAAVRDHIESNNMKTVKQIVMNMDTEPRERVVVAMAKGLGRAETEKILSVKLNMGEEVDLDEKVQFEAPTKDGNTFQVIDRDTKGMAGKQDKFKMQIVNKQGKVIKDLGSHASLNGAKGMAKNRGIIEEVELDEKLDKEDEPTVKKVVKMLKKASGAHAGQAKDLEKAVKEDNELDEGKMSQLHQMMKDGKSAEEIAKAMKLDLKTIKALTKEEVVLDEKIAGLVKKSKQTGVPYGILKKSYDRGIAAWRTGHRPGTTPQQWAFARVNSMLTGGKADPDLQPKARAAKKAKKASAKKEEFSVIDEKRHMDPADIDTSATDDDIKAADKNIMMQMRKAVSLRGQHPVEFMDKKKVKIPQKLAMAVIAKYNKQPKPMDKEKFQSKIAKSYKALLTTMKEQKEESLLDRLNRKILENSNG